ncbi:transient receptor potential cation channel subfamily A member 1-like [Osmerus mordax]|uniref:transient receptor potential cation channel subfamily A member 1-like n=1 Tax=Osmerus mordax TaxID=8014 RepID=UPI00351006F4
MPTLVGTDSQKLSHHSQSTTSLLKYTQKCSHELESTISCSKTSAMENKIYHSLISGDYANDISAKIFDWARQGNTAVLEKYPEHMGIRDLSGASPLHHASAEGHVGTIQVIVQRAGAKELNCRDNEGNTPLHWAVQRNQKESLLCLLEKGADPNLLNRGLMSPLHLAINQTYNTLVHLLLSHSGTDANLEGDLGNTPLMLACSVNNHNALQILFKHGAKLCQQNKLGHYPIHAAAFAGAKQSMQVILQEGDATGHSIDSHINYVDKFFSTPLHLAVRGGNLEVIKMCIDYGARIDQQQCDKSTALHFACNQGAMEAVKLMLSSYDRVCDVINITDGASQTPLHKATLFDHFELAEYLISKGADINFIDCKGHTPLLLATTCGAWKTVNLLLTYGADLKIKDKTGCSFLHLAILQPKGLKNLSSGVLQLSSVRELLGAEDHEGCTPLHYACRLGIPDSVKNILNLNVSLEHKSKQKKSALHFAAEYGRINTCHRLLDNMADTRLLNEGDEKGMTPLHMASRSGHVRVVELLLRRGSLFQSDYKGWTCLHYAAAEGYTQTMNTLLTSNSKLLNKTDEEGNTALHLASREGHTAAVMLLLERGAKVTLNKADNSFLHEAVFSGRKETTDSVILSARGAESLIVHNFTSEDPNKRCVVMDIIEFLPECFKTVLDTCIKESEDDVNSANYFIEYDFRWLQAPIHVMKLARKDQHYTFEPLSALNHMVKFNRVELLTHPVCNKYLEMKWKAYGVKIHLLNLGVYSLGLLPLTHLIINLRPVANNNTSSNNTYLSMVTNSFDKQCYYITTCMFLVLAMNLYAVGKEIMQIFQQRSRYFHDRTNLLDWSAALSSLVFVVPLLLDQKDTWHWQAGALAVLISWLNFLFYLQRFERFGIYVVMFREISKTLLSIILLFSCLMLAFALSFYALMIDQNQVNKLQLSVMNTFVMMVGEFNYQENILKPYLADHLPFPYLTFAIFIWFVLLVPILLMNLLIGLAVGDIAEVQNNAVLEQIGMQIALHTSLEEKLPYWFMKRVDQDSIIEHPNKACHGKKGIFCFWNSGGTVHARLKPCTNQTLPLEQEINKQKYRLKEISSVMEKQHDLLKLIIQKMEISSEAEEHDGPQLFQGYRNRDRNRLGLQLSSSTSRWDPVLQAIAARESPLCRGGS